MPHDHRAAHADPRQRLVDQLGLRLGAPESAMRAIAMAEARAIQDDDAMAALQQAHPVGDGEILCHRAIAVQQDDDRTLALVQFMQPRAIHLDEAAARRIAPFGGARHEVIRERRGAQQP
jgi:hypothetical protein